MLFTTCLLPHANTAFRKAICIGTGFVCVPVAGAGIYYGGKYSINILSSIFKKNEPKQNTPIVYEPHVSKPPSKFSVWMNNNWPIIEKYGEIPARIVGASTLAFGSCLSMIGTIGLAQYVNTTTRKYFSFVKSNEECCKLIRQTVIHIPRTAGIVGLGAIITGVSIGGLAIAERIITWDKSRIIGNACDKVFNLF